MPPFLRSVEYRAPERTDAFPFSLPILASLEELDLDAPVTLLAGENGSGKSTLLEAMAVACNAVAIGAHDLRRDPTLEPARQLAERLRTIRRKAPRRAMFFRAEDAFGFTQRLQREVDELEELEGHFRESLLDGSWGQRLAMGSARGQQSALTHRYGEDPDARSHGESFLHLLEERLTPGGLYLLDEPETPLSPLRQLALLKLVRDCTEEGSQFIIASHSPVLLAFPEAHLYWLDEDVQRVEWDELEHVQILRSFLQRPDSYLRRL
ncbi:MAG: AAA family ATPase [Acidobacteriota bacterium]